MLDLPSPVIEALAEILEAAADGKEVPVLRSPEDLTTEQAGRCPWRLPAHCCPAESGKIPARMVGTHRPAVAQRVLAYREAAKRRADALDELTREAEKRGSLRMTDAADGRLLGAVT